MLARENFSQLPQWKKLDGIESLPLQYLRDDSILILR
jgi:hypothetical protein